MKWAFICIADGLMKNEDLFLQMSSTTENSPYHREKNVLVHTQMVLNKYFELTPETWELSHVEGAFACLFHDVGKPAAQVDKFTEERGNYHSYPGHEIISARIWENWIVNNYEAVTAVMPDFKFESIYCIGWMIEHHLPYKITNNYKLECIYKTGRSMGPDTYTNVLIADSMGRTTDNVVEQISRMNTWIDAYKAYELPFNEKLFNDFPSLKHMHMFIGPSGAGKSTIVNMMLSTASEITPKVFSLDELRLKWYSDFLIMDPIVQYDAVHAAAKADPDFTKKWQREYVNFIKKGERFIIIDGTNLTAKHRRFFLDVAKNNNYITHGVYVTSSLQILKDNQADRTDKFVTDEVLEKQYATIQYPSYHEFDMIYVL